MTDRVSDAELADLLKQAKANAVTGCTYDETIESICTELQARRAADAKNGVGGTVAGCRERLCHSSDPHCQWPACHTAHAALGDRND